MSVRLAKLPHSSPRMTLKLLPAPRCTMQARTTGFSMSYPREPQEGKYGAVVEKGVGSIQMYVIAAVIGRSTTTWLERA
jgi:hypothetical protein